MLRTTTTVERARKIVGQAAALTRKEDQLKLMNEVRQWIYAKQDDLGIDLSIPFLVGVEPMKFRNGASGYGFRLPQTFQSVRAMEVNGIPVDVHSPLRSPYDGLAVTGTRYNVQAYQGQDTALERDFLCPGQLSFQSNCDEDQCMTVSGQTVEGRLEKITYTVKKEKQESEEVWKNITEVYFEEPTKSVIRLFDGKRELARYLPQTTWPQFRQYVLQGVSKCSTVLVRANRQLEDLVDDQDLVEFGESLVWQNLARAINMLNKADKDSNDRANMSLWIEAATDQMKSSAKVDQGQATVHIFKRKPIYGGRLNR